MALKVGATDVSKVYLGTTLASKVYLGTTQVWPTAAPSTDHSIYGSAVPQGTWAKFTDGTPDIEVGHSFYRFSGGSGTYYAGMRIKGARIYKAPGITAPPRVTIKLSTGMLPNPTGTTFGTVLAVKTFTPTWVDGWNTFLFETPLAMPADGMLATLTYKFGPSATDDDTYLADGTSEKTNGHLQAFDGTKLAWSDDAYGSGYRGTSYKIGAGTINSPGSSTVFYGIDLLVDESGTVPDQIGLLRSGRGASATTVVIDVTGARTLFLMRNNSATSLTSNNAGVTLKAADTGGPRRNSVWDIAPGTTGNVTFTANSASLWAYCLLDKAVRDVNAAYIGNNTTQTIEAQTLNVTSVPAHVVAFWNTNTLADWVPPAGWTMLETILTQNAEPSWMLGYSNAKAPVGAFSTPAVSRGKNGSSLIELEAVASVI